MALTELNKIFNIRLGNKFDANKMTFVDDGDINFISRDSKNNGCVGTVKKYNEVEPFNEGLITVSLGGVYLLSSFVQPKKFYTAQNVAVLTPKQSMNLNEKIFYCKCISMNRFKYSSTGREANKTIKHLKVPDNFPKWITKSTPPDLSEIGRPMQPKKISLNDREFRFFLFTDLFEVKKGIRLVKSRLSNIGDCPFVSSTAKNNGISGMFDIDPNQRANTITVSYDGSVGEAFYQSNPYWATDDVNVLYPKFDLNVFIAMFLITMIKKERYRFNYGRKWHKERMENSAIKLPVDTTTGDPDWPFMEEYIKSLPYTKYLGSEPEGKEQSLVGQATQKTFNDFSYY